MSETNKLPSLIWVYQKTHSYPGGETVHQGWYENPTALKPEDELYRKNSDVEAYISGLVSALQTAMKLGNMTVDNVNGVISVSVTDVLGCHTSMDLFSTQEFPALANALMMEGRFTNNDNSTESN